MTLHFAYGSNMSRALMQARCPRAEAIGTATLSGWRFLINPGLLFIVLAGIYLASKEHQWGNFYVGWGVIAALALGALEGSLIVRPAGRLAEMAERDLAATAVAAGGRRTSAEWSPEYTATLRRFTLAGNVMVAIVVLTIFFMATHLGA